MVLLPLLLVVTLLQAGQPPRDAPPVEKTARSAITGRVVVGDPPVGVAFATVYLMMAPSTQPLLPLRFLTDRNGRFTIDKLAPGKYRLAANPPEHSGWLLGSEDPTRPIEVGDGETVTAPDIRLQVGAAISGRIVDERNEPLSQVDVYAMVEQDGTAARRRAGPPFTRTDDQGRYRLFGLPPRDIIVVAEAGDAFSGMAFDRPAGFVATYYPGVLSDAQAKHITLRQGADIDGIDIQMSRVRTFRIAGTVIDSRGLPYAGAKLGLHHNVNGQGTTTPISVTAGGTFEIRGVLPGSYRLVSKASLFSPFNRVESGSLSEYANVPVDVIDSDVEGITLTTRPSVDLTIRVVFEPEPPSLPSNFGLVGWGNRELGLMMTPEAELTPDSTVVLKDATGPLVIRQMWPNTSQGWFLKGVFLGARDITDTPTEFTPADAARVRVVMTRQAATITGTVTDESGKSSQDWRVIMFPEERGEWIELSSGTFTASPDKDGAYKITGVRAGRYRIAAIDRKRLNQLYFERTKLLESLSTESISITVTENETRVVDLRVAAGGGHL